MTQAFPHRHHQGQRRKTTGFSHRLRKPVAMAVFLLAMCALAGPARALEAGHPAPEFDLPSRTTTALKLSDYKGRLVYLDFWASWCGPCKQSFPWMNDMQARYGERGLRIVGVNLDKKLEDAKTFLTRTPARFDVVFDVEGKTPAAYGVKVMPTSFLIAPNGKVLAIHGGFREEDRDKLERDIKQLLDIKSP